METMEQSILKERIPQMKIQFLKGVGPYRADILSRVGIQFVSDLLTYYPRDHQDRRIVKIKDIRPQKQAYFVLGLSEPNFQENEKVEQPCLREEDDGGQ